MPRVYSIATVQLVTYLLLHVKTPNYMKCFGCRVCPPRKTLGAAFSGAGRSFVSRIRVVHYICDLYFHLILTVCNSNPHLCTAVCCNGTEHFHAKCQMVGVKVTSVAGLFSLLNPMLLTGNVLGSWSAENTGGSRVIVTGVGTLLQSNRHFVLAVFPCSSQVLLDCSIFQWIFNSSGLCCDFLLENLEEKNLGRCHSLIASLLKSASGVKVRTVHRHK